MRSAVASIDGETWAANGLGNAPVQWSDPAVAAPDSSSLFLNWASCCLLPSLMDVILHPPSA